MNLFSKKEAVKVPPKENWESAPRFCPKCGATLVQYMTYRYDTQTGEKREYQWFMKHPATDGVTHVDYQWMGRTSYDPKGIWLDTRDDW